MGIPLGFPYVFFVAMFTYYLLTYLLTRTGGGYCCAW